MFIFLDGDKGKSSMLQDLEKKALEKGEEKLKSTIKEKVDAKVQETEKKLATKVIGQKNMDRLDKANEYLTGDMKGDKEEGKDDKEKKDSDDNDNKDQKDDDGDGKEKSGFGKELLGLFEGKKQADEENNKKK